jgi:hypothetical protein
MAWEGHPVNFNMFLMLEACLEFVTSAICREGRSKEDIDLASNKLDQASRPVAL